MIMNISGSVVAVGLAALLLSPNLWTQQCNMNCFRWSMSRNAWRYLSQSPLDWGRNYSVEIFWASIWNTLIRRKQMTRERWSTVSFHCICAKNI